jgi:hypothetical protein
MNAKRAPPQKKATDWSDIKKTNLLTETRLSWYHSIDEKHLWVHVNLDGGLSPYSNFPDGGV